MFRRKSSRLKTVVCFMLTFMLIFGLLPWQDDYISYAAAAVDSIEIMKIYNGNYDTPTLYYLTVYGTGLSTLEVEYFKDDGSKVKLTPSSPGDYVVQYTIPMSASGSKFVINGKTYQLVESDMPQIKGVSSKLVKSGDALGITANNLEQDLQAKGIEIRYFKGTTEKDITDTMEHTNNDQVTKNVTITSGLGSQNLEVIKDYTDVTYGTPGTPVTIAYRYLDAFRVYTDITGISGDIIIFPNKGKKGDTVTISADTFPEDYSVFLVENLEDPFFGKNLGESILNNHSPTQKDTITFKVPNGLDLKTYEVVLTNYIDPTGINPDDNLSNDIVKQLHIGKFTVVDGTFLPQIQSIDPSSGPDSGSEAKIYGKFFEELNIDLLTNYDDQNVTLDVYENLDTNIKQLEITYPPNAKYNGKDVTVKRYISVIVGNAAEFQDETKQSFKPGANQFDMLTVMIKPLESGDTDLVKDVVVNIETVLTETVSGQVHKISERAVKENAYTFIPSFNEPTITEVMPQIIPVTNSGMSYETAADMVINIKGKDFNVFKYTPDVGPNAGKELVLYPKIVVGGSDDSGEIVLKRIGNTVYDELNNEVAGASVEVYNSQGSVVDGTTGNEIGTSVVVRIPAGLPISLDKVNASAQGVGAANPIRKSENYGYYVTKSDAVRFVHTEDVPVIQEVTPNVVTVDGGEDIVIKGSNFASDVKVYIDGVEVTGIKRNGVGTQIDFKSPKGREGETILYVLNPATGGVATYPFIYVKTYTDPKITDFSPKQGKTGTLVVVNGDNFLKPDPTALEKDIFKLIGTRILLEGVDINEYNRDPITKQIELQNFVAANKVVSIVDGKLKVQDYYHSIVLKDTTTDRFYTLDVNLQGNVILSNGIDQTYTLKVNGSIITAEKDGGGIYDVTVQEALDAELGTNSDFVYLDADGDSNPELSLKVMTPFVVESGAITGDNVKVVDINKLYFTVPILPGDGYYDVTVINPDTKKDSKNDTNGFYYYTLPSSKPNIVSITPDHGSVDGGYIITITGQKEAGRECFVDDGTNKTKVSINGVEVAKDKITVSVDGQSMEVVVPALGIDLRTEYGTDRLTVPVVVVNPDGGSASKEDGFTYVIPTSHPEITKITPSTGSASGKTPVEISGKDFRFYEPFNDVDRDGEWSLGEIYEDLNGYHVEPDGSYEPEDNTQTMGPDDFRGKTMEDLKGSLDTMYDTIVPPVLPKVYFGGKPAEIIEFANGYLKVIPPAGKSGAVDVYVVNNDSGISNMVKYTYENSNPAIDKIVPPEGKKQGKDRVEVFGSGFATSDVNVYSRDTLGNYLTNTKEHTLVRFGYITNKDTPRELENSGRIDNGKTTVKLDGGLTVSYDGVAHTLDISILENKINYELTIPYNDIVAYVPVQLLSVDGNNQTYYQGYEWIRFEVSDRRLFVERGYAPQVEFKSSSQLVVTTPSYYTIGSVPVTVINPDGGEAEGEFEYANPDSKPTITNLMKDGRNPDTETVDGSETRILKVTYKGGNIVAVIGTDFRENAVIRIGDILEINEQDITYEIPNKLTFTMPAVDESVVGNLYRVVVTNEDKGNASSDEANPPLYIQFIKGETTPVVDSIVPDKGPASGGTAVTITGKDFREGLSVFFGDTKVPDANVTVVDYKTIKVITPAHDPGEVQVKIENPDGSLTEEVGTFTYLSTPKIIAVVDPADPTETSRITSISVLGGQEIKLKGSGFSEGARVVFMPTIESTTEEEASGTVIYIEGSPYLLKEGTDGTDVRIIDSETLTVKTPQGKMDSMGVIVINSDGGASDIYQGIKYGVPELAAPAGVVAELVYDRYIKVHWSAVTDAKEYEIYVVVDNTQQELIGSTELTSFVYEDLEPKTTYKFIVKAVGDFGSSKPSAESNTVRTGSKVGPPDTDGELGETTEMNKVGNMANVTIGTEDDEKELVINLTKGALAGSNEVTISIPASVVANPYAKSITVNGKDFRVKFTPNAFYTSKVKENQDKKDAGVRLQIHPSMGQMSTSAGQTPVSTGYILKAAVFVGKDSTTIDYLRSSIQVTLDVDSSKVEMRNIKFIDLSRYEGYDKKWMVLTTVDSSNASVMALTDRLGEFTVIGRRK
ncbi:MAG: IPT/TIG domain-containing protein [Bacillota bacterium]